MEGGGESILDAIFDEDGGEDVEMLDVEEGELLVDNNNSLSQTNDLGETNVGDVNLAVSRESSSQNRRPRKNKKKNKKKKSGGKKGGSGSNITDINKFVVDTCKRLRERKSYLKTADGKRFKTGGGILWNIIKARDPNAFKEIMKKGREFEKQFKQPDARQALVQNKQTQSKPHAPPTNQVTGSLSDDSECVPHVQDQLEKSSTEQKRKPVHDRIRVPVTYDDLVGSEDPKDESC